MHKTINYLATQMIWILTVFLLACFLIFDMYTWGKYAFLLASVLILFISVVIDRGIIHFKIGAFQYFMAAFTAIVFFSAAWAISSDDSLIMSRTLFRILLCFSLVYLYYVRQNSISGLLSAVMWAGYIVAVYSIIFYGLNTVLAATIGANTRLNSEYSNVNSIGMACALSCLIQFYYLIYRKARLWNAVFAIPAVLMMAATQSRKAIVFLIVGILALFVLKNSDNKNFIKGFFRIMGGLAGIIVVIAVLSQLEIFSGITQRLTSFLNMFTGDGTVDSSTLKRNDMVSLGLTWWKKHPLLGIGIANPHIIVAQELGTDAYLHNNFVELLCGGGIIAFVLYYSMYVYLFINLWRYRRVNKELFCICFVWLLLMLAMDYAMVSYYSKSQWFYLMIQFINVECLKRRFKEVRNEVQ